MIDFGVVEGRVIVWRLRWAVYILIREVYEEWALGWVRFHDADRLACELVRVVVVSTWEGAVFTEGCAAASPKIHVPGARVVEVILSSGEVPERAAETSVDGKVFGTRHSAVPLRTTA